MLALTKVAGGTVYINEKKILTVLEKGSGSVIELLNERTKDVVEVTAAPSAILALVNNFITVTAPGSLDLLLNHERIVDLANQKVIYEGNGSEREFVVTESASAVAVLINAL